MQWLLSIFLIAISLLVAFGQWYSMYTIPKKPNPQGQPRNYSMIPLVGGVLGMLGCFVCPSPTVKSLWWLPLLLDPGCALLFGAMVVFGVISLFRHKRGHPMKVVYGDLLALGIAGEFDVIIHGCNCQNTMGAGIAKSIKARFPEAYEADCETEKESREKLGSYSSATVDCDGHEFTVVNAYTQFHWKSPMAKNGERGFNADYEAIRSVFAKIKSDFAEKRIGYPRIGAGLAGGDWSIISQIISEELEGEDHTLVEYRP